MSGRLSASDKSIWHAAVAGTPQCLGIPLELAEECLVTILETGIRRLTLVA